MKSDPGFNWKDHKKNGMAEAVCSYGFGSATFTRPGRMWWNGKYSHLTAIRLCHQLSSPSRTPLRHQFRRNPRLQDRSVYGSIGQSPGHVGTEPKRGDGGHDYPWPLIRF